MVKLLYKPVGLLISVAAGTAASVAVRRVWTLLTGQQDAPKATDQDHSWREVLLAAGVQGAVFGLVKAAIDRGGATGIRKITGTWPGT
ncbi:MAG: DUF4235 domain-containing protein [Pseudonocardiaceae bacterium]